MRAPWPGRVHWISLEHEQYARPDQSMKSIIDENRYQSMLVNVILKSIDIGNRSPIDERKFCDIFLDSHRFFIDYHWSIVIDFHLVDFHWLFTSWIDSYQQLNNFQKRLIYSARCWWQSIARDENRYQSIAIDVTKEIVLVTIDWSSNRSVVRLISNHRFSFTGKQSVSLQSLLSWFFFFNPMTMSSARFSLRPQVFIYVF